MSSGKSQWLFKRLIQTTQHHSGLTCKILGMKAQHFVFNKHFMCAKLDTHYMAKGSKFEVLCRKTTEAENLEVFYVCVKLHSHLYIL